MFCMPRLYALGLFLVCSLLATPGMAADGASVTVFAAASLKNAMDDVATVYETRHPHTDVKISYAGSSTLARQIEAGAPADVYVSANERWMDQLQDDGLIQADSRRDLLRNDLVLVAPEGSNIQIAMTDPLDLAAALPQGRYLAMADTRGVPAGIYGRQALQHLGAWHDVSQRIAQAEDVRAALALVARGEAPLGIVYASDALAEDDVRVVARFPGDTHKPIVYPAALTRQADSSAAAGFLRFLSTPQAAERFQRWGFQAVAESH